MFCNCKLSASIQTVLYVCLLELLSPAAAENCNNCTHGTEGVVMLQQKSFRSRWTSPEEAVPSAFVRALRLKIWNMRNSRKSKRRAQLQKQLLASVAKYTRAAVEIGSDHGITVHSNKTSLHALFGEACDERTFRWRHLHQKGSWHDSPESFKLITMKINYSIRDAGLNATGHPKGLGLFAEEDVLAGQPIYGDWVQPAVKGRLAIIPYTALPEMQLIAKDFPKVVVDQFFEWCEDNWLTETDGLLCELDKEHYANHSPKPNMDVCEYLKPKPNLKFNGMCALHDIKKGEELTENYNVEMLDRSVSEKFAESVQAAAGTGHNPWTC